MSQIMKKILSNLVSLILPFTVLVLVPYWLTGFIRPDFTVPGFTGIILLLIGLGILFITISSFVRIGKGTLAPWNPTKKLVITGLHAYVRNPMILGVSISLGGEALLFSSMKILLWFFIFILINHFYFIFFEEPSLKKRFGNEYVNYKKQVNRWIPRMHPYQE